MNVTLLAQVFNLILLAAIIGLVIFFIKSRLTAARKMDKMANDLTEIRKILEERIKKD